ncbi:MAG: hypothetical protein U9R75_05120, partial [Candidatus Thermoplasmatota archaeon]|nr:hypothetical protein [Candidatus Thermoplasmatota archaeon]
VILLGNMLSRTLDRGPVVKEVRIGRRRENIHLFGILTVSTVALLMISGVGVGIYGVEEQVDRLERDTMGQHLPPNKDHHPPGGNEPPPGGFPSVFEVAQQAQPPPQQTTGDGSLFHPEELTWALVLILLSSMYVLFCAGYLLVKRKRSNETEE